LPNEHSRQAGDEVEIVGGTIGFVTLLLGLLSGPHEVALHVEPGVTKVEVRLDGAPAGTLAAPPWTLDVDFGHGLAPRVLEAVAFDASGTEIGRARQTVNLPRAQAEATISLERDARGVPVAALVHWQGVLGARPWALRASLDGFSWCAAGAWPRPWRS
jgi:hypothetical protein